MGGKIVQQRELYCICKNAFQSNIKQNKKAPERLALFRRIPRCFFHVVNFHIICVIFDSTLP